MHYQTLGHYTEDFAGKYEFNVGKALGFINSVCHLYKIGSSNMDTRYLPFRRERIVKKINLCLFKKCVLKLAWHSIKGTWSIISFLHPFQEGSSTMTNVLYELLFDILCMIEPTFVDWVKTITTIHSIVSVEKIILH